MQTSACFSIPKLPNVWVVVDNSWDEEDFLVTAGVKMSVEIKVFLMLSRSFLSVLLNWPLPVPLGIPMSIIMGWVVSQCDAVL